MAVNCPMFTQDPLFAEQFIFEQGIERLLNVVLSSSGNVQAYAINALRCFMGYSSGLHNFLESPELIDKLFYLLDENHVVATSRQAIELLFVLCNYEGWSLVHKAAKFTARLKDDAPYRSVLRMFSSGDLDTQLNALTLLTSLMDNAPSRDKLKKLVLCWRDLGLDNILEVLLFFLLSRLLLQEVLTLS